MSNAISKLAFFLVSYNFIVFVILIAKIALQYAFGGAYEIADSVWDINRSLRSWLVLILMSVASLASIVISINYVTTPLNNISILKVYVSRNYKEQGKTLELARLFLNR